MSSSKKPLTTSSPSKGSFSKPEAVGPSRRRIVHIQLLDEHADFLTCQPPGIPSAVIMKADNQRVYQRLERLQVVLLLAFIFAVASFELPSNLTWSTTSR